MRPKHAPFVAILALALAFAPALPAADDLAKQVLAFTGASTRIVWPRYVGNDKQFSGLFCDGPDFVLMCFDTSEGKERVLRPESGSYGYPMITRDGTRVIWTDNVNKCGWISSWDGKQKEKLIEGTAFSPACLRWDPVTKEEWVYSTSRGAGGNPGARTGNYNNGGALYAVRIEGLKAVGQPTVVFDKKGMWYPISVSEDGVWGATEVGGWPNCGLFNIATGEVKPMTRDEGMGCFASIAPDSSYRHYFVTGSHHGLWMFDAGARNANRRLIKTSLMAGNEGKYDVQMPKWSNQTRFLTIMWPFNPPKTRDVPWGNICLGRFNAEYTAVEWLTISSTTERQSAPEAWIMPGPSVVANPPVAAGGLVLAPKTSIALATPLADVELVYTLDGREPLKGGKTYSNPIEISFAGKPVQVKARAIGKGGELSLVSELSLMPAVNGVEVSVWPAGKDKDPWTWFAGEPKRSVLKGLLPAPRSGPAAVSYRALMNVAASAEVMVSCNGRLSINGKQVADNGTGKINLSAGLHDLVITYAGKDIPKPQLLIESTPGKSAAVPASSLFLPPGAGDVKDAGKTVK